MGTRGSEIEEHGAHLTREQMQSYRVRTLGPEELALAGQHLSGCDACRRALRSVMGPIVLPEEVKAMPEPLHLTYAQITAYLDGKSGLQEKERTEAHFFLCASCSRELEDLRRLDLQLAAPVVEQSEVKAEPIPLRQRLAQFFAVPGRSGQLGFASAAMIAGFVLLYRADLATESHVGVGGAAHVIRVGAELHPGLSLGGILLVGLGLGYLLYVLLKKR